MPIVGGPREVLTPVASTGITAAILLPTSGTYKGKKISAATFQPSVQACYVNWDGTAADNTCLLLAVGDVLRLEGYHNLCQFRTINAVAGGKLLVIPEYRV
jgi:hypothetical protein